MTKITFSIFVSFSIICCNIFLAQESPIFVKNVYDNMFASMSNGNVVKPKLIFENNPSQVISFYPTENELRIGTEFIQLCRNFGKDSANALAHVIGHELAHILLQQNDFIKTVGSGYASKEINKQMKSIHKTLKDSVFERQADEYAAFYAHIAGYNTIHIGEQVLDSIYLKFKLNDKDLSKYPTLQERKLICKVTAERMIVLKLVFDTGNLATIAGNYDYAISCYETIIKEKFPSREIFNNLSAVYLLKAIQEIDTIEFPYFFPVEIDLTTRLQDVQRSIFSEYEDNLLEAIRYADLALGAKKDYSKAWLNKAIAEFLLDKKVDAIYSLHKANELKIYDRNYALALMEFIFEHKYGDKEKALKNVSTISKNYYLARKNEIKIRGINSEQIAKNINSLKIEKLDTFIVPQKKYKEQNTISVDTLKNRLIYVKNMQLKVYKHADFTAFDGKDNLGATKPTFTYFQLNNVPIFTENEVKQLMLLPHIQKSEHKYFYLYGNWIIEVEGVSLRNCYIIR